MIISNCVADKIRPSHAVEILRKIKSLNGKSRSLYFARDGLEFDFTLTTYGDIIVAIKHTRI